MLKLHHVSLYVAFALAALPLQAAYAGPGSDLLDSVTRLQQYTAHRESSAHPDLHKNGDARSIDKGQTLVLGELEGPGVISHIWCTIGSEDPFVGRSLVLRIYWDGAEKPSVEAPLGDFFGVGHGAMAEFTSLPVCVNSLGRARVCYWRMPFEKSAKVTVTNESEEYECDSFYYYLDWQKHESLPEPVTYFHAQYRQAMPAQPGDYTILETTGQGHYVGTVYSVHQMENGWFGEGDDRFYIDGEETPSLRGTGSEDYFNDAWGFRAFATPFYGVSLWEGYFAGDRVTAYRWHLADPVPFKKSLKVTIEHRGSIFTDQIAELGGFFERQDWISSVAFWYQTTPAAFDEKLPPAAERLPPYRVIRAETLPMRANPSMLIIKQGGSVLYFPQTPDASIEFDFEVEEKGHYRIDAAMAYAVMGSVYQAFLDGEPIGGPIDFFTDGLDILPTRLDLHVLEAGKHTLRFEGRGTSPRTRCMVKPLGHYPHGCGLHYLMLLRLEDMEGFQEGLKKALEENPNPLKLW